MRIGFHLTPFWSPTDRAPTAIIDEAIEVVRAAAGMGFAWVSIGHHWLSHPTVWPHPIAMLSRLAPEAGDMRLKTSMLLLPLLNPVDVAESVVTLDHITHGRLDVGVAIGYRERELEAAGLGRKDRVPKLEESLSVMKRLWRGDEVTFEGAYTKLTTARLGLLPCQRPHRQSTIRLELKEDLRLDSRKPVPRRQLGEMRLQSSLHLEPQADDLALQPEVLWRRRGPVSWRGHVRKDILDHCGQLQ